MNQVESFSYEATKIVDQLVLIYSKFISSMDTLIIIKGYAIPFVVIILINQIKSGSRYNGNKKLVVIEVNQLSVRLDIIGFFLVTLTQDCLFYSGKPNPNPAHLKYSYQLIARVVSISI